jgi:hypothetical protein
LSYITPDTDIWILRNVPLDKSYTHTYFPWIASTGQDGTRASQFTALVNYLKPTTTYRNKSYSFHLQNYSYQRRNLNKIRVKIPYDILYDCNYLIFRNHAYEDKYFYAFIDNIDYINDNTSQISYSIDVMQTWHFDYTLNQCFVEREHASTDNRGDNILQEPIGTGEMVVQNTAKLLGLENESWYLIFVLTCDSSSVIATADGCFTSGVWNQAEYWVFKVYNPLNPQDPDVRDTSYINTHVKQSLGAVALFNRNNAVVTMYMCPESLLPNFNRTLDYEESLDASQVDADINISFTPSYGSWTPNNQKLFTYPYCFFTIDNNQGQIRDFKYEFFRDCRDYSIQSGDIQFREYVTNAIKPIVRLVPMNYLNVNSLQNNANYEYAIDLSDFAIGTWATNDLTAKVVQGAIGLAITAATLGAGSVAGGAAAFTKTLASNIGTQQGDEHARNLARGAYNYGSIYGDANKEVEGHLNALDEMKHENEPLPWGGLGKDLVKTAGALTLLGMRSHISSSVGNGNINVASRCFDFIAKAWHVDERYARKIDQFFDMYGYQTNSIKLPNRKVRPHFTYTKTTNCTVDGYLPHDDAELIQSIYNNGITFWKNVNEIGDYSVAANGGNAAGQG